MLWLLLRLPTRLGVSLLLRLRMIAGLRLPTRLGVSLLLRLRTGCGFLLPARLGVGLGSRALGVRLQLLRLRMRLLVSGSRWLGRSGWRRPCRIWTGHSVVFRRRSSPPVVRQSWPIGIRLVARMVCRHVSAGVLHVRRELAAVGRHRFVDGGIYLPACLASGHCALEVAWSRGRGDDRSAAIDGGPQLRVGLGLIHMLYLRTGWQEMVFPHRRLLLNRGLRLDAA